jgi:hypothetical protein
MAMSLVPRCILDRHDGVEPPLDNDETADMLGTMARKIDQLAD